MTTISIEEILTGLERYIPVMTQEELLCIANGLLVADDELINEWDKRLRVFRLQRKILMSKISEANGKQR